MNIIPHKSSILSLRNAIYVTWPDTDKTGYSQMDYRYVVSICLIEKFCSKKQFLQTLLSITVKKKTQINDFVLSFELFSTRNGDILTYKFNSNQIKSC